MKNNIFMFINFAIYLQNQIIYINFMIEDSEKLECSQSQIKNKIKIINHERTNQNLSIQLGIVNKIIVSWVWIQKDKFTTSILYEITKFVFKNPIQFFTPMYKHIQSKLINAKCKINHILFNTENSYQNVVFSILQINSKNFKQRSAIQIQNQDLPALNFNASVCQNIKKGQYSIKIKILKSWKKCNINHQHTPLRQIISKSKHLIDFFKNVQIDHPRQTIQLNQAKWENNQNFQNKQQKLYTLICQNFDQIYSQICQIQHNQKLKRLDHSIIKIYSEMMNRNILILSVEKNNGNNITLKSQGKYIYFQNFMRIPLKSQRFVRLYGNLEDYKVSQQLQMIIPHLQCNKFCQWSIRNSFNVNLQLFQQCGLQIDRSSGTIIDRSLNLFQYDDFQVTEI